MKDLTKHKNYRNTKITKSAEGEECQFNLEGCSYNNYETVWAHSDYLEDGKGRGLKASEILGTYSCNNCHMVYSRVIASDYSDEEMRDLFHRAMKRSILLLLEKKIIK